MLAKYGLVLFASLGMVQMNSNGYQILYDISTVTNITFTVTSNVRSKMRNALVGGLPNSKHLCGQALDIRIKDLTERTRLKLLKQLRTLKRYDVVLESDHIHIEVKNGCNENE